MKKYTKEFKEKIIKEVHQHQSVMVVSNRYGLDGRMVLEWVTKRPINESLLIDELYKKIDDLEIENKFFRSLCEELRLQIRKPSNLIGQPTENINKTY